MVQEKTDQHHTVTCRRGVQMKQLRLACSNQIDRFDENRKMPVCVPQNSTTKSSRRCTKTAHKLKQFFNLINVIKRSIIRSATRQTEADSPSTGNTKSMKATQQNIVFYWSVTLTKVETNSRFVILSMQSTASKNDTINTIYTLMCSQSKLTSSDIR